MSLPDSLTLDERFEIFHAENPHVFEVMVRLAREAKARGRRRIGAKALAERARWELAFAVEGEDFKINNSYVSRYARLLAETHPELADLFEFRRLHDAPGEAA